MALLFVALFNSVLGLSILFPILAPLGRQLGLREVEIGSLSVAYAAMQLALAPIWGRRSDAWGRKPVMLIGVTGFALSFAAFAAVARYALAHEVDHAVLLGLLIGTRLLGGALSSATFPTGQAFAADLTPRDRRTSAMAVIGAAFGLGIIFGPGLGAALATAFDDLLAPVWCSAGVAVVNAGFIAAFLREPERRAAARPRSGRAILRRVWPVLAIGLGASLASVAMEQTLAFSYQDRLGLGGTETARAVGLALLAYGVVAVVAQGVLVRRLTASPLTLLRIGLPVALAGFVGFVYASDYATLTISLCLQGLGQGLLLPAVTSACSLAVGDQEQGAVAGLHSGAQALARTIGPVVGPALYQHVGARAPYVFCAAMLGVLTLVLFARPQLARPDEPAPSSS